MKDINNLKKSDTGKIQLTIAINFMFSKNTDEERLMHSSSDDIEIMINDKADEVIEDIHLWYYNCHKINPNRVGSYIDSPDWIKNKKATKNLINKNDNKCFQYAATLPLIHEELGKDSGRITKIKPFIDKYNWEEINYPSEKDDWKKFEKNNVTIALNVLCPEKKVYPAYVSKQNSKREKQVVLLMIPNWEGLYCNKKGICIIKKNNLKKQTWFLLSELSSFV